jgi:hypothetical protein
MTNQTIRVVSAKYVGGHQLWIGFSDGVEKVVDFSRWLQGKFFVRLLIGDSSNGFSSMVEPSAGRTALICAGDASSC